MLAKFPASKLVTIIASVISFAALWAFIAGLGWSGGSATQAATDLPPAAPLPNAPAPVAPAKPQVIVQQTTVVRRIHVSDGGAPAGAPSAPVSADVPRQPAASAPPSAPAPAAPPPPQAAAPQPARAAPAPVPVTTTRGS
jgi:hypothetical protein